MTMCENLVILYSIQYHVSKPNHDFTSTHVHSPQFSRVLERFLNDFTCVGVPLHCLMEDGSSSGGSCCEVWFPLPTLKLT